MYEECIKKALNEDLGLIGDITSRAIFGPDDYSTARVIAKQDGVVSGLTLVSEVFPDGASFKNDGDRIKAGDIVFEITDQTINLLERERIALNYLSHLSGIATQTSEYVNAIKGTKAKVTCTRKTLPGIRALQKKAVKDGGGANHRFGLFDMVMIKDNHIAACGGDIVEAIRRVKENVGHTINIEVEVDTLDQLRQLMNQDINIVMLDNMSPKQIEEAIKINDGRFILEASGGITLDTIKSYAETGVDYISVGALTHSVKAFDFGMDIVTQ